MPAQRISMTVTLDADLAAAVRSIAERDKCPVSFVVEGAIAKALRVGPASRARFGRRGHTKAAV